MLLTKASIYAIFAVVYLAERGQDRPVGGRVIADAHGIPAEYLLKILQQLVRAQVLTSETGRRGGFTLRRPPAEISLLQIVEAIDGPIDGEILTHDQHVASDHVRRELQQVSRNVAKFAHATLAGTTIEVIARRGVAPDALAAL